MVIQEAYVMNTTDRIIETTSEAGVLCLDFANTMNWHASEHPIESLNNYADLVAWAQQTGALTGREAQQLSQAAEDRVAEVADILGHAIDLREAIYRIFSATTAGYSPAPADLVTLNAALNQALPHLQVVQREVGFIWAWIHTHDALDVMLWPVARSAAELLTSDRLDRVKVCEDDRGCGYLFLDMSKNRSRRWCSMESCGNRAKVRRHRRRKQDTEQ
jgi:predicted RNA-binding Zn ribbon-like protein